MFERRFQVFYKTKEKSENHLFIVAYTNDGACKLCNEYLKLNGIKAFNFEAKTDDGEVISGRFWRIRGTRCAVKASCVSQALKKLLGDDCTFTYIPHWYTKSHRKSWTEFETNYGYSGVIEEVF